MPRHAWQDSLHANTLRERVLKLRYPRRDVDTDHNQELVAYMGELSRDQNEVEFLMGIYSVLKPALRAAYVAYLAQTDELDDAPSHYHIQHILIDEQAQEQESDALLTQLDARLVQESQPWVEYLSSYLQAIGGLLGEGERGPIPTAHPCAGRPPYQVPRRAVRDSRYRPATVHMPGRNPKRPLEHQIWNGINHANELWAAEVPGTFAWHWPTLPWSFQMDAARWSYDELRHGLMGIRRMQAWGFEPGIDFPMVADHYHALSDQDPILVLALLHEFETKGPAWKQTLKTYYEQLGDQATAQDCDFDWADEAIHLRYGHSLLRHLLGPTAAERQPQLQAEAHARWDRWIAERWQRGEDGYGPFMERIDARIAAVAEEESA